MQIDRVARDIRHLAREQGLRVELERVQDIDGKTHRFWWFYDRVGRPPVGGEGAGLQDQAALEFLRKI